MHLAWLLQRVLNRLTNRRVLETVVIMHKHNEISSAFQAASSSSASVSEHPDRTGMSGRALCCLASGASGSACPTVMELAYATYVACRHSVCQFSTQFASSDTGNQLLYTNDMVITPFYQAGILQWNWKFGNLSDKVP